MKHTDIKSKLDERHERYEKGMDILGKSALAISLIVLVFLYNSI